MAFRDIIPWAKRGRGSSSGSEMMRGVVEPLEHLFEKPWGLAGRAGRMPEVDVEEKPEEIVVAVKLPGMKREDVKIEVTENTLTIRAEQARSQEQRRHGVLQRRESSRSFLRRFSLPSPVRTGDVKAAFKGERLEIHLPRVTPALVRRID
ncbi:MAG: Hsp20/alpha crystallin family protein, partial [Elusimicrobia bacterium]|nr:Hsp20/alpha crystallin family protein [Elusimicrobiota bacterium]